MDKIKIPSHLTMTGHSESYKNYTKTGHAWPIAYEVRYVSGSYKNEKNKCRYLEGLVVLQTPGELPAFYLYHLIAFLHHIFGDG